MRGCAHASLDGRLSLFHVAELLGASVSEGPRLLQLLLEVADLPAADLEPVASVRQVALLRLGALFGFSDSSERLSYRLNRGRLRSLLAVPVDLIPAALRQFLRCRNHRGSGNDRRSPDGGGHVNRTEPRIAQGGCETTRPDGFAGAGVGKRRLEGYLELASDRPADGWSKVASQTPSVMAECSDGLAPLSRQPAQVLGIEVRVGPPGRLAELEQLKELGVPLAPEKIGKPRARRGTA